MAEPTIIFEANSGSEGTPTWAVIGDALRFTGPDGVGDAFVAPIGDDDDAFFDGGASPNDGEIWNDTTVDVQIAVGGRTVNQNVLRVRETGTTDPTADPPEFTAYDDSADGAARTDPTVWVLVGTSGTSNVSCIRAIETTLAAPDGDWTGQDHDNAPVDGFPLDGNKASEKVVCASILAASATKEFGIAGCLPHDSTAGLTSFIIQLQYTYS